MAKTPKQFYSFDQHGCYLGPVEGEKCPENATEKKPTESLGDTTKINVFNGVDWEVVTQEDFMLSLRTRSMRDAKLKHSDFTQCLDFPGDVDAWAKYRQDLRDLPKQKGFPNEIEWPTAPSLKPLEKKAEKK